MTLRDRKPRFSHGLSNRLSNCLSERRRAGVARRHERDWPRRFSAARLPALLLAWVALGSPGCRPGAEVREAVLYRDLAAAGAGVRLEGDARPVRDGERADIWLGVSSVLEVTLFAAPGSSLRAAGLEVRGRGVRLEIDLDFDDDRLDQRRTYTGRGLRLDVPLGLDERTPVRIRLAVSGPGDGGGAGSGVQLEEPGLWAPATARGELADRRVAGVASDSPPESPPPHVVVYLIDTLRRDRLGCYGYGRETSPRIDRFADGATVYERAIAQSSWTKASIGSLFTGVWPPEHGATGWKHSLPQEFVTLAEAFSDAGYETAAFVTNPNVLPVYGFDQGFDHFDRPLNLPSAELNELVFRWLENRDSTAPFFLYVHTMDPHAPYTPIEPYRSRLAPNFGDMPSWSPRWQWPVEVLPYLSDAYDAEIAANDESFGVLVDHLRTLGVLDETTVVLLSDHGEEFRDHGRWRHGNALFGESIDLPLLVKYAGQRVGARVERPVQHIDLFPTLLEVVDASFPQRLDGTSLRADGDRRLDPSAVFSHLRLGRRPLQYSVVEGDWKLIRTHPTREGEAVELELFDRASDPRERVDRTLRHPIRAAAMSALLDAKLAAGGAMAPAAGTVEIDPQLERELRALGYLR